MSTLRETGPYIYPTWLPKLLAGLDRCEWKIWFQVQHDGKTWQRLDRGCQGRWEVGPLGRSKTVPLGVTSQHKWPR